VLSIVGGTYRVFSGGGTIDASLRGRMKRGSTQRVLVGDEVILHVHGDESVTIEEIAERRSLLKRRTPGKSRGVRAIAANVDQVVVVGAADHPRWDPHLMDRFLVMAEANRLPAVVVVNKSDLVDDAAALGGPYEAAGYDVLVTCVKRGEGIEALRQRLAQRVSLFTGSTGVGKSSLLNALQPGLRLRTGEVSRRSRAGRHTTTAAEMHSLHEGGFVVDTPGLRDVGLWGIDPRELGEAFPEFAPHVALCRFDNCRHVEEPGCAVVVAAEAGEIHATRLESYRRFLEEAAQAAKHWE
jgi:ribosome biogenesis GTPase